MTNIIVKNPTFYAVQFNGTNDTEVVSVLSAPLFTWSADYHLVVGGVLYLMFHRVDSLEQHYYVLSINDWLVYADTFNTILKPNLELDGQIGMFTNDTFNSYFTVEEE